MKSSRQNRPFIVETLERRDLLTTVSFEPALDTSLFEDSQGTLSNGAGEFLFAGRTKQSEGRSLRRAMVAFDLNEQIPVGATINSVSLSLHLSKSISADVPFSIHRVTNAWGEGTSDAQGPEGKGADATPGDSTWMHNEFPTEAWAVPGGDFLSDASATTDVGAINQEYVWSSDEMIADVNAWLQTPGDNFGWILKGGETLDGTAKRFHAREHGDAAVRPTLTIDFSESQSLPTISISDASVLEGDANGVLGFVVTLSAAPTETVSVDFTTTADGNAIANGDFVAISDTLLFELGDPLTKTIEVLVIDDIVTESDEVFALQLSNVIGAELIDATAEGIILNDDAEPTIAISSATINEGDSQITSVAIPVELSHPSAFEVTVTFNTTSNTAQNDDYIDVSTTVTFAPGETSQSVDVEVIGDTEVEPDEVVDLELADAVGGTIASDIATLTILNDDGQSSPWQNPNLDLDVNDDGAVIPRDVLFVINYINANGAGPLPDPGPNEPPPFYDVTGDNFITSFDALRIINFLNANPVGEPAPPPVAAIDLVLAFSLQEDDEVE